MKSTRRKNLLTVRADDRLTYDHVIAHQRELLTEPRLKPGMRCLVDITAIKSFPMTGRDMFRLAQARGEFPYLATNSRTAVVVNSAAMFAMARMYALSRRKVYRANGDLLRHGRSQAVGHAVVGRQAGVKLQRRQFGIPFAILGTCPDLPR
jgi:hypothetical protein